MGCVCSKETVAVNGKKFKLINKIADGGFGTIHLVEEFKTYKLFALKRVKCEGQKELETASLENKYYKQLNSHSNLIKLVSDDIIGDKKDSGFFILSIFPFYQNGTLQNELEQNLKSNKFIENDRLMHLFYGLCSGLNFIHEANLAHRDLKPHNILMSNDRQEGILTDYGSMTERRIEIVNLKKSQEIQEWASQNCSMFFRAPELFDPAVGSSITESADIWSLGCVFYAMMFNKGPFDYVCERGDSIALAVANANYTISNSSIQPPEFQVNLLKQTLVVDDVKRQSLTKIMEIARPRNSNI